MKYKITKNGFKNLDTGVEFQAIPTLPEYETYLLWEADGNVAEPEFTDKEILQNAKDEKITHLKVVNNAKLKLGLVVQNIKMDAFNKDVVNLHNALTLEKTLNSTSMEITDYENNQHSLSLEVVESMLLELAVNLKTIREDFIKQRVLINNASQ